mmetsp:Transcript_73552/g.212873  ORF Transcript_73552/g.212873 Transcript_73552/m.212873 type:complete len:208 (+) Transcript_73552:328-951(+)
MPLGVRMIDRDIRLDPAMPEAHTPGTPLHQGSLEALPASNRMPGAVEPDEPAPRPRRHVLRASAKGRRRHRRRTEATRHLRRTEAARHLWRTEATFGGGHVATPSNLSGQRLLRRSRAFPAKSGATADAPAVLATKQPPLRRRNPRGWRRRISVPGDELAGLLGCLFRLCRLWRQWRRTWADWRGPPGQVPNHLPGRRGRRRRCPQF